MKQLYAIMVWMMLLTGGFSSWAHEVTSDSLILLSDSSESDTLNLDPEWYVAPEIPVSLRAPMRANAAAACTRVEAIQTFNIDSVLTEGTYYEYDAKGNVISTTVWAYAPDGTMTGKSKNEYAFDAAGTQTMTAVYIWDGAANDWKGTEKYEYVYKTFAGEKKMISNTSSVWLNGAWVADQRFTYDYDASLREISYFEYRRNTSTNELQPVKGREQSWTDDLQTLEALYTAYANGKWTAGTKKEWAFDGNGTQTMYATYTISNGAWVGSSKETWAYNTSSKLTLHEKYGWAGNDWSITLQENTTYDASGNTTLIENYTWSNGVKTGTKKEQYSFDGGKPVLTMVYAWSNGAWIGSSKEVWNYNASSKLTLHEKYGWTNNDWSLTLQEKTVYSGANITLIENYTWSNGIKTGTKKEEYTYSGSLKTSFVTYSWAGSDWVGASKEIWAYTSGKQTLHETYAWGATDWSITLQENTAYSGANITKIENYTWTNGTKTGTQKEIWAYTSGKQTLHETYAWGATDWSITLQENTAYSGANITKIENYAWTNGTKTGTQKEEYAYTGSQKTQEIIYAWTNDAWVESTKETWGYTSGKLTHHEQYTWNGDWSKTLEENTVYDGTNVIKIENYTYADGVKTGTQKEEYTYTSGEKTKTVVYAWATNDWVYSTKNEAGYRDGNVEVSATNYAWNGSAWVGTGTRTQTTYDGTKIIEKLTKNWPSGATDWTNAAITTNAYNAEDINVLVYNGTWDGNKWVLQSMARLDIIKDAAGHELLNASWTCGSDSVWVGVKKDTAAYTATNKPLYVASYKSWANGDWVPYSKSEYTYDANDHQILYMQYEGKNGVWVNKNRYENSYDSEGRELLKQAYTWSKNAWVGSYKYEYEYDADGNQTKYIQYKWSSGKWKGYLRTDKEYDSHGNVTMTISYDWYGNAWVGSSREDCVYDENNRLIESIQKEWDDEWINFRRTTNYYDNLGRNVSVRNYWWYNNEWALFKIEDKEYELSSNVLRRELSASWLNNKLQSYVDKQYFYNCDPHFYTVRFVNYDGKVLANMTAQEGETPTYVGSNPTREGNAEYSYTFSGWNPTLAPVTANITYTATFTATKNTYTITWKNENGTVLQSGEVAYGEAPVYTGEMPSRPNTAEYTYTFAGWTPGIGIVTGDATYTATFTATKNKYLITFKDEDGSVLKSEELEYGVTPTAPSDPTKASTAEDTYTFSGWDKEVVTVTEAATYIATYTATKKTYTITWKNEDGSVIESETLEYGATPAHANINKENTAEYTYTFAGWSPEIVPVAGDAEYTATYTATKKTYTITWKNEDGTVLQSGEVAYGEAPVYIGEMPSRPNTAEYTYAFNGWDKEVVTVTEAATYTATYTTTKNSYTITWKNEDGSVIKSGEVAYGEAPVYTGEMPSRPNTAEYTYTFAGWSPEIVPVAGDAEYTATYDSVRNSYTINWKNEDGTVLQSGEVAYGEAPVYTGEMPSRSNTAEYTYTFAGWSPEIVPVAGDAEYTATYTATKNTYTITWKNEDGTVLQSGEVAYGEAPVYIGEMPSRLNTAENTYTFAGWSPQIVPVTGDAEYTATYTTTKNTYTITWKNEDGMVLQSGEVAYGEAPVYTGEMPSRPTTAEYTYTFTGWTPQIVPVTGDAEYTALFDRTKNTYTITWKNEDGTVLQSGEVAYGEAPVYTGEMPSRPNTAENTYTFSGWDKEVVTVTEDATYTATYTTTKNSYTITWKNEDGTVLQSGEVAYGEAPVYIGEMPSRPTTAEYTYTFAGWDKEVVTVTEAATYTATYTTTKISYTITWKNEDGTVLQSGEVAYGEAPVYTGEMPSRPTTAEYTYTFTGWTPQIVPVTGDATYTATYTATERLENKTFTITFYYEEGGIVVDRVVVAYGETPSTNRIPSMPSDERYYYTFSGWSPEIVPANSDADYVATFTAIPIEFRVTFKNYNGRELQSIQVPYGEMPEYTGEIPARPSNKLYTYTFIGWTPEITEVTGNATYTALFETVSKTEDVEEVQSDNVQIEKVLKNGILYIMYNGTKYNLQGQRVQ